MFDTLVTGGLLVTPSGERVAALGVQDGVVASVDADPAAPAHRVIDATGAVVLPGLVDPHVHLWDPGATHREDWAHGTRSAAAGGVTTVIEMPLSIPPTVDSDALDQKIDRVLAHSVVDVVLWGGIVPAAPKVLEGRLAALAARGVPAFKLFMCDAAAEFPACGPDDVQRALQSAGEHHVLLGVHAEDSTAVTLREAELRAQGRRDPRAYAESRAPQTELAAIEQMVAWVRDSAAAAYLVHVSLAEGVAAIRRARQEGSRLYAETCPHYLVLDLSDLEAQGPWAKCAPPLRERANVERMWDAVLDGSLDTIGSDHAPFSAEEKRAGLESIWEAPNGLTGLQTMLPLLVDEGVHRRGLSWSRLAELTSGNAARIFGLPQKGRLAEGADADLAIVDPDRRWVVRGADLASVARWTPYEGRPLRGAVRSTLVRGAVVYDQGRVTGAGGSGRLLQPSAGGRT